MLTAFLLIGLLGRTAAVGAVSLKDFENLYRVDLETDRLPSYEELQESFQKRHVLYDTHYTSVFDLGNVYDREFYAKVAAYGLSEKRLKWPEEEALLEMLAMMPRSWYEYVGPMLFEIPTISEKVLNMPGIRETKNKFPSRIAKQLQDIEDIEFLSPYLYFILMPEMWPGHDNEMERPKPRRYHPKIVHDENFYRAIRRIVPPEKYAANLPQENKPDRSRLRTINPDKNSLLTAADVQAFVNTLDAVQEWANQPGNRLKLATVTTLLQDYETAQDEGNKALAPGFRDIINPCARLVQKATILGQERELALRVAKEGFTLHEWAYTCDKTVRAYRLSYVSSSLMQSLRLYRRGYYDEEADKLSPRSRDMRYATMQAVLDMYNAPLADVLEVRKKRDTLYKAFFKHDFEIAGTEIARLD